MGAALKKILEARGDRVIGVDLRNADVVADLSTPAGREPAVAESRQGIRVNGVVPCVTDSPFMGDILQQEETRRQLLETWAKTTGRFSEPEEIAEVIAFLLSPQASYIYGQMLFVDGGFEASTRP